MYTDLILDTIHEQRGNALHRGRIGGVALHPVTRADLEAENPDYTAFLDAHLNGWAVIESWNVPENSVRIVPAGRLEAIRNQRGQVCRWPAFTIRTNERAAQLGPHVTPSGRLEPWSPNLDGAFNPASAERLARSMGGAHSSNHNASNQPIQ